MYSSFSNDRRILNEVVENSMPLLIRQQGSFMVHKSVHSSVHDQVGGLVVRQRETRIDRLHFT